MGSKFEQRNSVNWTASSSCPTIDSNYGSFEDINRDTRSRAHIGIDIVMPENTPFPAPSDGVVIFAKTSYEGGNVTTIWAGKDSVGNNYYLSFAHQSKHGVVEGQHVKAGELAGFVGNTGGYMDQENTPHLHFQVEVDAKGGHQVGKRHRGRISDPNKYWNASKKNGGGGGGTQ